MFARSIILLSSALLTTTASPVAQDDCNIQSGTCPIEDSPIPDWVKKLNDPNSGPYKGSLDTADILPCKDLTQCMGDSSPLMESATQYYGFKGCSASQKRALVQMQADAIRIVRSVANYDLDWDRDEALLEFFGPAESTLKSTCRKRIPEVLKNINNHYNGEPGRGGAPPELGFGSASQGYETFCEC